MSQIIGFSIHDSITQVVVNGKVFYNRKNNPLGLEAVKAPTFQPGKIYKVETKNEDNFYITQKCANEFVVNKIAYWRFSKLNEKDIITGSLFGYNIVITDPLPNKDENIVRDNKVNKSKK